MENYDLCLNTSALGYAGCAEIIKKLHWLPKWGKEGGKIASNLQKPWIFAACAKFREVLKIYEILMRRLTRGRYSI